MYRRMDLLFETLCELRGQEMLAQPKATTDLKLNSFLCSRSDSFVQWTSCHRTFIFFFFEAEKQEKQQERAKKIGSWSCCSSL